MGDEETVISSGLVVTPDAVSKQSFTSAFRGYHPAEVREFLQRVADELAAGAAREVELRRALQDALHRAAHPELDEAALTALLGEHAARLLATARDTAASITAEAQQRAEAVVRDGEEHVRRLRDEGEEHVRRLREEAEGLMARRVAEADKAAASIRQAAEAEARAGAERAAAEAEALIESATRQGKDMVAEARAVRERMLGDLSRRRRGAQVQLEQLRAGVDRLLAAYEVVRRTADEATAELGAAEPEARKAAEVVARRADDDERTERLLRPEGAPEPRRAVPAPTLSRRTEDGPRPAPEPPAPDRTPLRPQTVAGAVARPPSPALPPPRPAPPPPRPPSELATGEVPAITAATPRPERLDAPEPPVGDVEALFARIRANEEPPPAPPAPPAEEAEAPAEPEFAGPMVLDPLATEQALEGRDELLDSLEAGLTRALKRVLQDEQNEVLDGLRRLGPGAGPALLPALDAHVASYREAAMPWLQQAARAGVAFVSDPDAGPAEGVSPSLESQARALAADLVEPLRERLARAVEGGDEPDDPAAVAERLRAVYRQWKVQQVEECARHAALSAFNVGAFAATPPVAALQWLVDDDGHCPDCDDNALAGPTTKGEPFPTGQLHPPAHPGCRCVLVAVGD